MNVSIGAQYDGDAQRMKYLTSAIRNIIDPIINRYKEIGVTKHDVLMGDDVRLMSLINLYVLLARINARISMCSTLDASNRRTKAVTIRLEDNHQHLLHVMQRKTNLRLTDGRYRDVYDMANFYEKVLTYAAPDSAATADKILAKLVLGMVNEVEQYGFR